MIGRRGTALAEGVRLIRGGEPAEAVANLTVLFEPFELLSQRPGAHRAPADGAVAAAAIGAYGVRDGRPRRSRGRRAVRGRAAPAVSRCCLGVADCAGRDFGEGWLVDGLVGLSTAFGVVSSFGGLSGFGFFGAFGFGPRTFTAFGFER